MWCILHSASSRRGALVVVGFYRLAQSAEYADSDRLSGAVRIADPKA
jgi:hypothetical protein